MRPHHLILTAQECSRARISARCVDKAAQSHALASCALRHAIDLRLRPCSSKAQVESETAQRQAWLEHVRALPPSLQEVVFSLRDVANAVAWAQTAQPGTAPAGAPWQTMIGIMTPDALIALGAHYVHGLVAIFHHTTLPLGARCATMATCCPQLNARARASLQRDMKCLPVTTSLG